jgi:site-specific DNA-methyltransferase (adenine-specific)
MAHKVILGNCEDELKNLPDNSIDSVVTDPPYELGFMGKSWDSSGIAYNVDMWKEVLRVLKPGGYLLSFGGSRTYHRMACAIEDAGFDIRDQIMWVYGSGFPKSLDVAKAIDKMAGVEFEAKPASGVGFMNSSDDGYNTTLNQLVQTGESTDEATKWKGWGTALKPAHEPIVMARKPLSEKTVAKNVLEHGTGGINIDGSRIGNEERTYGGMSANQPEVGTFRDDNWVPKDIEVTVSGRWPANFIHDGSDEVLELFPDTGKSTGGRIGKKDTSGVNIVPAGQYEAGDPGFGDSGSAARYFYCAKTSKKDRNEGLDDFEAKSIGPKGHGLNRVCATCGTLQMKGCNCPDATYINQAKANHHPTVKPTDLMRYLVRMVTPPDGTVLDPFTGSGSTGKAAILEGFNFVGVEQNPDYIAIAEARIEAAESK